MQLQKKESYYFLTYIKNQSGVLIAVKNDIHGKEIKIIVKDLTGVKSMVLDGI